MGGDPHADAVLKRAPSPVALVLGALLVAGGVTWAVKKHEHLAGAASVQGRVVELDCDEDRACAPIVTFSPGGVGTYRIKGHTRTSPSAFDVGDSVDLLYDPTDPADATIDAKSELWFGPGMIGFFGAVVIAVAFGRRQLIQKR